MILEIDQLNVEFSTPQGVVHAIKNVSLKVPAGQIVGIVGESGSGKSVTSLAVMGLLPENAKIRSGKISLAHQQKTAMIFQDPMTSLNPAFTVGWQVEEALKIHQQISSKVSLREKSLEYLSMVGIPDPASRLSVYPHQLSGGLAQRVMIAIAMACDPKLLIADEPTTALDVTIQAQILSLLRRLQKEKGLSVVLISHDMGVIAQNTQSMYVMYAGEVMEEGPTKEIISKPSHPYTKALLSCLPSEEESDVSRLSIIPGMVPNLFPRPSGCIFYERCELKKESCQTEVAMKEVRGNSRMRCVL